MIKDKLYYGEIYDRITVEHGRQNLEYFQKTKREFLDKQKVENSEKKNFGYWLDRLCFIVVDAPCGERWLRREKTIDTWIAEDKAKEQLMENTLEPSSIYCTHCKSAKIELASKDLMSRNTDTPNGVLFMYDCVGCKKRSAYWPDGSVWVPQPTKCMKCESVVSEKHTRKNKVLVFSYKCSNCGYSHKDNIDFSEKDDETDPNFERDKKIFCFDDKRGEDYLRIKQSMEGGAELMKELKERENNKKLYDAVESIEKLTVIQLNELISSKVSEAGYVDFKLDRPDMGKNVIVGFNCLDNKTDRNEHDSEKTLRKIINATLKDTNWRLMSDRVSYRLGYLSGRFRAYESEEALAALVSKKRLL